MIHELIKKLPEKHVIKRDDKFLENGYITVGDYFINLDYKLNDTIDNKSTVGAYSKDYLTSHVVVISVSVEDENEDIVNLSADELSKLKKAVEMIVVADEDEELEIYEPQFDKYYIHDKEFN